MAKKKMYADHSHIDITITVRVPGVGFASDTNRMMTIDGFESSADLMKHVAQVVPLMLDSNAFRIPLDRWEDAGEVCCDDD